VYVVEYEYERPCERGGAEERSGRLEEAEPGTFGIT
jgi:hypothetical protein